MGQIIMIDASEAGGRAAGSDRPHLLSKSRYVAGLQCRKMLWWMVHEPEAPELVPDERLGAILNRGHQIRELARARFPDGVLIDLPHHALHERVAATTQAIVGGAAAIYEASFIEDGVFVAADVLERRRDGFALVEVKSTLDVKKEHLPDVAIQLHVLRLSGLTITRAELMHLNRECRYPNLSELFVRERVTSLLRPALRQVPKQVEAMKAALAGPLPDVAIGPHCTKPRVCPFIERCWPALPSHHVSTLYRIGEKGLAKLVAAGIETIDQLPPKFPLSGPARRQVKSIKTGKVVVTGGLSRALAPLKPPLAFLDFETINPAVPFWPGCRPYEQIPVQFSCHVLTPSGMEHHAWLAEGPGDPREAFVEALIRACAEAKTVLAYNASFERRCINIVAQFLPERRRDLVALSRRLRDLLPVVRDYVYHPDFGGSFSLKDVLPALVPGLGYDDLVIRDGGTASDALEALLLNEDALEPSARRALREDLLRYCERDTFAMVRLHDRLRTLAGLVVSGQDGWWSKRH